MRTLGEIIRSYRQSLNITMNDLADLVGTSQSAISYIENDKRLPHRDTLKKICDALKINDSDYKEMLRLRNQLAHGSLSSKLINSKAESIRRVRPKEILSEVSYTPDPPISNSSDLTLEIFPGYITSIEIKTKKKIDQDSDIKPGVSNVLISNAIETALTKLIMKESSFLEDSIELEIVEHLNALEALMLDYKKNSRIKIIDKEND